MEEEQERRCVFRRVVRALGATPVRMSPTRSREMAHAEARRKIAPRNMSVAAARYSTAFPMPKFLDLHDRCV